ncbi:MAG: 4-alpha-glucanotransferase, partial [Treponema sp.]|nr:4-alpha-glucanotransferase [Treponema sp.]
PWNEESARNLYLPENFKDENCVVYTGTHDNNTTAGTLEESPIQYRWNVCDYLGLKDTADVKKITYSLISCALSSRAKYCIIPVQDFLCTGSEGRMNTPSKASGNWSWRLLRLPSLSLAEKIRGLLSGCSRL